MVPELIHIKVKDLEAIFRQQSKFTILLPTETLCDLQRGIPPKKQMYHFLPDETHFQKRKKKTLYNKEPAF